MGDSIAAVGCLVLLAAAMVAYPFNPRRIRRPRTAEQQRTLVAERLVNDRQHGAMLQMVLRSNPLAGWSAVALTGAAVCYSRWHRFDSTAIAAVIATGAFGVFCVLRYGLWPTARVVMDQQGVTVRDKLTSWQEIKRVEVYEFEVGRYRQDSPPRTFFLFDRRAELQVTDNAVALPFGPRMALPAVLVAATIGAAHDAMVGGTLPVDLAVHRRRRASGQRRAGHREGELNTWAIVSVALAVVMWVVGFVAVLTSHGSGRDDVSGNMSAPGAGFMIAIQALGALVLLSGITGLIQTRLYAEDGRRAAMFGIVAGAVVLFLGLGVFA